MNLNKKYNLALELYNNKEFDQAILLCNQIIDIDKNNYLTWNLLGNIFFNLKDFENAKHFFIAALNIKSDFIEAYYMLGNVLFEVSMFEDAINIWQEALKYTKKEPVIYTNISSAYIRMNKKQEALKFANKALEINNTYEDAFVCIATIYKNNIDLKKCKIFLQKALKSNPTNPLTNFDLAYIFFIEVDLKKAYKYFEYRKLIPNETIKYNYLPFQEYNGEDLKNKKLLIYHEQGFGDNIQFARFLNNINSNNISFGIQNSLNKLFSYNFPNICFKKEISLNDEYDFCLPIMSIPYKFNIYNIKSTSFLKVKNVDIINFKETNKINNKINIGIVWKGSTTSNINKQKSLKLKDFELLFKTETNRTFYSLQVEEKEELIEYPNIIDLGKNFKDFYDTAVAICSLDLIISIDTAVAHLAGALGQKTYVLNNKMQFDWRWVNKNKKSIWYDSISVFKYKKIEDIIKKIDKEINEL